VLARIAGLAVAAGASAANGAMLGVIAAARAGRVRVAASTAAFGAMIGAALCVLLRQLGWADLSLFVLGAGYGPWGELAVVSLPLAAMVAGATTAMDAREREANGPLG
jgi:hypothetical protein